MVLFNERLHRGPGESKMLFMKRGDSGGDTGRAEAYETVRHGLSGSEAQAFLDPLEHAKRIEREVLTSEAAPEELADGPTHDEESGSEWSERDERLLKWLIGPRRESLPNTLFEVSELQEIDIRLQGLMKDLTETQKFTVEQIETMKATIDATREASTRIGRKDWVLLGIGALSTLVLSAAFPPATVVHATKLFLHGVAHLYGEEVAG